VNVVTLIGRLGADPELRHTRSGMAVANLRVATSDRRKVGDTYEEHTDWHRVTVWGKQAESCGRFLAKGRQVGITGRLTYSEFEAQDGTTRKTTEIVAERVEFLGERQNERETTRQWASRDQSNFDNDPIPF